MCGICWVHGKLFNTLARVGLTNIIVSRSLSLSHPNVLDCLV